MNKLPSQRVAIPVYGQNSYSRFNMTGRYYHRVYKENTDAGVLAVIPSLNKLFLLNKDAEIPAYILSEKRNIEDMTESRQSMQLILLLTTNCNLSCRYCYEYSSHRDVAIMSDELIQTSLAYIFDLAARNDAKLVKLTLFGGEPTLAWDKLMFALSEGRRLERERSISLRLSIVTNGSVDRPLDRIITDIDHFSVSVDGPPDIQDALRPTRNGEKSSDKVFRTVDYLYRNARSKLSIRATITPETVNRMNEIAAYFASRYPGIPQYYEPLMPTDRYKADVDIGNFFDRFQSLLTCGEYSPSVIKTSLFSLKPALSYCGMERRLVVYPNGTITGCHRVNIEDPNDQVNAYFRFGRIENNTVRVNEAGLQNAMNLSATGDRGRNCEECFAKFYCRGGCPAIKISAGLSPFQRLPWCDKVRQFYINYFLSVLKPQNIAADHI